MIALYAVALATFKELLRGKVLFVALFFAFFLVAVTSLFGSVTLGDQLLVIKDFGLFAISLFTTSFVVIAGSSLLHKELSRRTIFVVLSKPLYRAHFVLGKFAGLFVTALLMELIMSAALSLYVSLYCSCVDLTIWYAVLFSLFEIAIVCALVLFFSSVVVTPLLAGLLSFALFIVGRSAAHILYFAEHSEVSTFATVVVKGLYRILPHFDQLAIANEVVYNRIPNGAAILYASGYSVCYAAVLLTIAIFFFSRREFN